MEWNSIMSCALGSIIGVLIGNFLYYKWFDI